MADTVRTAAQERAIETILVEQLPEEGGYELVGLDVAREDAYLYVVATLRATHPLDQEAADDIARQISAQLDRPIQLEVVVLPAVRSR